MEEKLEMFFRRGIEEERIEMKADEVLNAIAEGRDIYIVYAVIDGDLDISKIADRLKQREDGERIIRGRVAINESEIRGNAVFTSTQFSGRVSFWNTQFSGEVSFSKAQFGDV